MNQPLRIAVVGGGVAGVTAAYLLSRNHLVTIFEKNSYLGGHTNTIVVPDGPDAGTAVDTGFIVCNPTNYPNFYKLLARWGVELRDSDMSFGFHCEQSGLRYMGPALLEFVQTPANFLRPAFLHMLLAQRRFNRAALSDFESERLRDISLGQYVRELKCPRYFIENYLLPLSAAIWSSPDHDMLEFPAATFVAFFRNHGMLELGKRPRWQTVVGGSHAYLKAFKRQFPGEILLNTPAVQIERRIGKVMLRLGDGQAREFDRVVIAAHADEALRMLVDPSSDEKRLLSSWSYHRNQITLHTDDRVLAPPQRLWASWNYFRRRGADPANPVPITYYMNRLQGLNTIRDYFVTLNGGDGIDPEKIIYTTEFTHPAYRPESVRSQNGLREICGVNSTYYCGSYMRYGFHEDAVSSAAAAASQLGCPL